MPTSPNEAAHPPLAAAEQRGATRRPPGPRLRAPAADAWLQTMNTLRALLLERRQQASYVPTAQEHLLAVAGLRNGGWSSVEPADTRAAQ